MGLMVGGFSVGGQPSWRDAHRTFNYLFRGVKRVVGTLGSSTAMLEAMKLDLTNSSWLHCNRTRQ